MEKNISILDNNRKRKYTCTLGNEMLIGMNKREKT